MTGKRIGAVARRRRAHRRRLLLRNNVLDDDAEAEPTGSTTTPTTGDAPAAGELICITELGAICRALGDQLPDLRVTVQDAGATLDALATLPDDAPRPLWLTIQPYPEMLDSLRTASNREPFGGTAEVVAASQLSAATSEQRATDLAAGCADEPLWRCIGANAGNDWTTLAPGTEGGPIRPSIGDAGAQAVALASFADAVAGYYGRPDIRSSDWQNDPAFTPWVSRLLGQVDASSLSGGTPLATMAMRPSLLDVAATTEAELTAVGGDRFVANYPEPSMWAEAVVAVPDRTAVPDDAIAAITDALLAGRLGAPRRGRAGAPGRHDHARPPHPLAGVDVMNAKVKLLAALAATALVAARVHGR